MMEKFSGFFENSRGLKSGVVLGLVAGFVFSFSLPAVTGFIGQTLVFTAVLGTTSFLKDRYGWKAGIPAIAVVLIGLLFFGTNLCSLMGVNHEPARNTFTREIDASGGFDGVRLMTDCDRGQYPWYYQSLNEEEVDEYCSENSEAYCALRKSQATGLI